MFYDITLENINYLRENWEEYKVEPKFLNEYSLKEINNFKKGKVSIANNYNDITTFVLRSKDIVSSNAKLYLGKIRQTTANNILEKIKIETLGYNVSLKNDAVKHILKKHGNMSELLRGQIPIKEEDFLLISEIITNYDKIEITKYTHQNVPSIKFEKRFKYNYVLIINLSKKNKNLEVQTMYKKAK